MHFLGASKLHKSRRNVAVLTGSAVHSLYCAVVTRVVPRTLTESLSMKDIFILLTNAMQNLYVLKDLFLCILYSLEGFLKHLCSSGMSRAEKTLFKLL